MWFTIGAPAARAESAGANSASYESDRSTMIYHTQGHTRAVLRTIFPRQPSKPRGRVEGREHPKHYNTTAGRWLERMPAKQAHNLIPPWISSLAILNQTDTHHKESSTSAVHPSSELEIASDQHLWFKNHTRQCRFFLVLNCRRRKKEKKYKKPLRLKREVIKQYLVTDNPPIG